MQCEYENTTFISSCNNALDMYGPAQRHMLCNLIQEMNVRAWVNWVRVENAYFSGVIEVNIDVATESYTQDTTARIEQPEHEILPKPIIYYAWL